MKLTINERADAMFEEWARTPVGDTTELFRRHLTEQFRDYVAQIAGLKEQVRQLKLRQWSDANAEKE